MLLSVISSSFARPADTVAYAIGDLIANSTTAGSVVPLSFPLTGISGTGQTIVLRARLSKTNTSPTSASFRLHLYEAAPVVANGDNGAWSTSKAANYLGNIDVASMFAFTDGCTGYGAAVAGAEMRMRLSAGTTLYGLLEARAAYTPGSAESFTAYLECLDSY
jgi:hypothetical protein